MENIRDFLLRKEQHIKGSLKKPFFPKMPALGYLVLGLDNIKIPPNSYHTSTDPFLPSRKVTEVTD